MASPIGVVDRSFAEIVRDAIRNVEEIVRSELRLVKAETREAAARAKPTVLLLVSGAVTAIFALLFLFFAAIFALALVMPLWAASLAVGTTLALVAGLTLASGVRRFKLLRLTYKQSIDAIARENVR